jgi:hypothetical protein
MSEILCPKCNHFMSEGFIVDRGDGGMSWPTEWSQGKPEKSFWTGTKTNSKRKVTTYCCEACGFLESYAIATESLKT